MFVLGKINMWCLFVSNSGTGDYLNLSQSLMLMHAYSIHS